MPRSDHLGLPFSAHRPCAGNGEPSSNYRVEKSIPTSAEYVPVIILGFGLFEGVVDGDWKSWVCLLGEPVHRLRHAIEEERLGFLFATMAVWSGDKFLGLGHSDRREEIRKYGLQRTPQPNIEEIRQVGIADVVVVRRVGRDHCSTEIV